MLKKIVCIILCLMLLGSSSIAMAVDYSLESVDQILGRTVQCGEGSIPWNNSQKNIILPNSAPRYEDKIVRNRVASIDVDIQAPLEDSWIAIYSTGYYYQANQVIERIDDFLYDEYGIDSYCVSQPSWTYPTNSALNPLQYVTAYVGKGNADIMLAFAGDIASPIFGEASIGNPYSILYDHGYTQNCKSAQHEIGHTYGLEHCSNRCVMQQGSDPNWYYFEHLCGNHGVDWMLAKEKY